MENDMQNKVEQRLAELPQDVQAAIASSEFDEKVHAIGKAQGLHIDQMEALSDEIMLGMLGFVELDDLPHGIEHQVRVTGAQAQAITDAVNQEIFRPIRESMKAWAAQKRGDIAAPTPVPGTEPSAPSVVMPSSPKPEVPPASVPVAPVVPAVPPALGSAPATPTMAPAHDLVAAEAMLSEKKVTPPASAPAPTLPATPAHSPIAKVDPAQPQNYKADPYREPVE